MDFKSGKKEFLKIFDGLNEESKCRFARWVGGFCEAQIEELPPTQNEELLDMISDELRKHVDVPGGKIAGEIVRFLYCDSSL